MRMFRMSFVLNTSTGIFRLIQFREYDEDKAFYESKNSQWSVNLNMELFQWTDNGRHKSKALVRLTTSMLRVDWNRNMYMYLPLLYVKRRISQNK